VRKHRDLIHNWFRGGTVPAGAVVSADLRNPADVNIIEKPDHEYGHELYSSKQG
jgi:hypothetical protein